MLVYTVLIDARPTIAGRHMPREMKLQSCTLQDNVYTVSGPNLLRSQCRNQNQTPLYLVLTIAARVLMLLAQLYALRNNIPDVGRSTSGLRNHHFVALAILGTQERCM